MCLALASRECQLAPMLSARMMRVKEVECDALRVQPRRIPSTMAGTNAAANGML